MRRLDLVAHRLKLFPLRLIYHVLHIHADDRLIRGDLDDVHAVDLPEFLLLRERGAGHARFLAKFIKQILKCDGRQRLALPLYLDMLLRLDRLMQAVRIAASRHDAPGKLIDDKHLLVLHHIILVAEHQVVRAQRQDDIVLDLQIFRVGQVLNMEELLHLLHAVLGEVDVLFFLAYDKIPALLNILAHDGVHLRKFAARLAPLQLPRQDIARLVELCGLAALPGYNKRRPRLVNQHGVNLVDDGVLKPPLHKLFLVDHHVIPQVVEPQLIIRDIGNIAVIRFPPLVAVHAIEHHTDRKPQKLMDLSHPLCVTLRQVVVDRHDMDALACQRVQIGGERRYQRLPLPGLHLSDAPLMQDNAADKLYMEMPHAKRAHRSLPDHRIRLRQDIV